MIERLRKFSYILAYAVATIPLWHYIRDGRILAVMVAVVTFAYVMVVLSSVQVAMPILSREKSKTTLPRWLPDKPKYHTWWMLVRRTLKWHLLLVIPKMGLAYGFSQWLHLGARAVMTSSIMRPYFYASHAVGLAYPDWETVIIAIPFLTLFTICESSLIASLILITSPQSRLLVLRLLISLSIIGVMNQYQQHFHSLIPYEECCSITIFGHTHYFDIRIERKVTETIETGFLTLSGFDILHSANLMKIYPHYHDNRPFVARQVVAGLLGLILYAGATWVVLWFVEDENPSLSPSP